MNYPVPLGFHAFFMNFTQLPFTLGKCDPLGVPSHGIIKLHTTINTGLVQAQSAERTLCN